MLCALYPGGDRLHSPMQPLSQTTSIPDASIGSARRRGRTSTRPVSAPATRGGRCPALDWATVTYSPFVDVTQDTTALYASDCHVFLFPVDETDRSRAVAGRIARGAFPGFHCWNSAFGSKVRCIASFSLCASRNASSISCWASPRSPAAKLIRTQGPTGRKSNALDGARRLNVSHANNDVSCATTYASLYTMSLLLRRMPHSLN